MSFELLKWDGDRAVDEGIRGYTSYTHLLESYNGGIPSYTHILMGIVAHRIRTFLLRTTALGSDREVRWSYTEHFNH